MTVSSARGLASVIVLTVALLALGGCAKVREKQAIAQCKQEHTAPGGLALTLLGTEGVAQLCQCTFEKVYSELPDADSQVRRWLDEVKDKTEKRGLLGALSDSGFAASRGGELAKFVDVYGKAWTSCTVNTVLGSKQGK